MNELLPYITTLLNSAIRGFSLLLPELTLVITFLLVVLTDLFVPERKSSAAFWVCLSGIIVSMMVGFIQNMDIARIALFDNTLILDSVSISFKAIFSAVTLLFAIFIRYNKPLQDHRKGVGDLYMLLPAVLLGLNLMSMSASLLMIYLSIEMVSIASYLMVGYASAKEKQTEAAMKYALFGSICSAVMLYGMSLLYGFTGSLNILDHAFLNSLSLVSNPAVSLAITLVLVGIGFKLSFVPLHFWSPDVYEGAPTPVTAFLSTAPKIAGFAVLIRFIEPFLLPAQPYNVPVVFDFRTVLIVIALTTMIVGNFAAIWQDNVKRMLAFSGISHAGFMLMTLLGNKEMSGALLYYAAAYALAGIGAFAVLLYVCKGKDNEDLYNFNGLGKTNPALAAMLTASLLSMAGIPIFAGFFAKFMLFSETIEAGFLVVVIAAVINSVISVGYYFKLILAMYTKDSTETRPVTSTIYNLVAVLSIIINIAIGIYPQAIMSLLV